MALKKCFYKIGDFKLSKFVISFTEIIEGAKKLWINFSLMGIFVVVKVYVYMCVFSQILVKTFFEMFNKYVPSGTFKNHVAV